MREENRPFRWWIVWCVLSAGLLIAVSGLYFDVPLWTVRKRELIPLSLLLGAFVVSAVATHAMWRSGRSRSIGRVGIVTLAIYGLAFFALVWLGMRVGQSFLITIALLGVLLVPAFYLLAPWRLLAIVALALITCASSAFSMYHVRRMATARVTPHVVESYLRTSLYTLSETTYVGYVKRVIRGGAIARVGDRYLLSTGEGHMYVFGWGPNGEFAAHSLPYVVPLNGDEFAHAVGGEYRNPQDWEGAKSSGEVQTWRFRVADLLAVETGGHLKLFASHHYWNNAQRCYVLRVSMLEGDTQAILQGAAVGPWKTVFDTKPCMSLDVEQKIVHDNPFKGEEVGGRLKLLDEHTLVLTVGAMGYDGVAFTLRVAQEPAYSYGKTLLIHLEDGSAETLSMGHRNQQGLYIDSQKNIWSTEHGPQGGDELNLLRNGKDYGWPTVTYGTDYGTMAWPLNPHQGEHDGFELPIYAWVPSIGISNLVGIDRDLFARWHGDLIIGSLAAESLYRTKIREQRAVLVEPIPIGHRVRDIDEGPGGELVLWTDDASIVVLKPANAKNAPVLFANMCGGCHTALSGAAHGLGPNLWGIVGARVAARAGYDQYSPALHNFGGSWDEARLDKFLANPQAAVPGTAMAFPGIAAPAERKQVVEYLKTLH